MRNAPCRRGQVIAQIASVLLICALRWQSARAVCDAPKAEHPTVTLAGEVELARLVDLSADRLAFQIQYDASALKGTVTLRSAEGLSDQELWTLTNQVLAAHGLTTVAQDADGKMFSVVKLADAPGMANVQQHNAASASAGFIHLVVRVEHQPTKNVVEAVKLLLSKPSGAVTDLGIGGLILISDIKSRADQASELISTLDVPATPPIIQRIPAQFVNPTQLGALATAAAVARDSMMTVGLKGKLIPAPDGDALILVCPPGELESWTELIARFDERQSVQTVTYAPKAFASDDVAKLIEQSAHDLSPRGSGDQWKITRDDLTGTLIVTATPGEHERIAAIMQRLDAMPRESRRPMRVFAIRNRSVREIVNVASRLMETGVFDTSAELSTTVQSPTSPTSGPMKAITAPPILDTPAARSAMTREGSKPLASSILATPNGLADPTPLAKKPSQTSGADVHALAQASLLLTQDEGTNTLIAVGEPRLLAQLENLIRVLDVRQPQVMVEVIIVSLSEDDTLDLGAELKKIEINGSTLISLTSLFGLGTSGRPDGGVGNAGRGFTGVILNPGDFSVVIRALQTLNRGRTMSLPKVLVNNGQQATLDSVLQQPFVSVNASDTVATTSFGGSENAGTIISIKPQIAQGDHLVVEYSIALSAFVGRAVDPTLPPPKQSNNLASIVTIPDGYTVVVGGLEISTDSNAVSQIPLVGSIPIIGEAFKNRSISKSKNRFYVFIHCDVLRHEGFEDLKYLSDRAAEEAGIDDGWPVVEPRVIP